MKVFWQQTAEILSMVLGTCRDLYSDGPGVMMELVQNADDAGASEVAFMLDGRSYATDSVIGVPFLLSKHPSEDDVRQPTMFIDTF